MSTEKMRDTYEAWASSVLLQGKVAQEFIKVMREGDTYSLTGYSAETSRKYLVGVISAGWMSWQASRAAIEVELPERREIGPNYPYLSDLDIEWNACLDEVTRLNTK
ncbi:hypothetical protein H097_10352 [Pseudomonas sp. FH4]|uniref:hypothetical protein n=1 Tax=Pseudomonas sp. FH4 TaxID=1284393 RepID=UPI0003DDDA7B|nr:hypothetical protein [Pseudomonas sp. FH4]ETK19253.1 hypothetical protein H097_10352 [Pseudomonas sp. FH4]